MHEKWLGHDEENSKLLEASLALYTSAGKILPWESVLLTPQIHAQVACLRTVYVK
jgi:hypothetical protein